MLNHAVVQGSGLCGRFHLVRGQCVILRALRPLPSGVDSDLEMPAVVTCLPRLSVFASIENCRFTGLEYCEI